MYWEFFTTHSCLVLFCFELMKTIFGRYVHFLSFTKQKLSLSTMPLSEFCCLWCCLKCNFVHLTVAKTEQFYLPFVNDVSLLFFCIYIAIHRIVQRLKQWRNLLRCTRIMESQFPVPSQADALTWQTCICIHKRSWWCLVPLANTCQGNRKEGKLISWR